MYLPWEIDRVFSPHRPHKRYTFVEAPPALMKRYAQSRKLGLEPADAPAPRINLPSEKFCNVASSLASGSGCRIGNRQHQDAGSEPYLFGDSGGPGQAQHRVIKQSRRGNVARGTMMCSLTQTSLRPRSSAR